MGEVYPLLFEPIFKERIWGGRNLERLFGKPLPAGKKIGESWELADLESDQSRVATGEAAGRTIRQLVEQWKEALIGPVGLYEGRFPLLIKFLDAEQTLSVQVHPDAAAAEALGEGVRPKYEAWYVVDARLDAAIYCGLKEGVTKQDVAEAAKTGTIGQLLRRFDAKPGDFFYLPAGTVHALGAGLVVAEVQTPSDVTYRLFDWNRVDPMTGRPRQLHLAEALECIRPQFGPDVFLPRPTVRAEPFGTVRRLISCEAFTIDEVKVEAGSSMVVHGGEPVVWMVIAGCGRIRAAGGQVVEVRAGQTILFPAGLEEFQAAFDEGCTLLEVRVPH